MNNYIPHGFDCDFSLIITSDGEWQTEDHDLAFMRQVALCGNTHVVTVLDCEGAPFCIAPLPIARWIMRVMDLHESDYTLLDEAAAERFRADWRGSGGRIENP